MRIKLLLSLIFVLASCMDTHHEAPLIFFYTDWDKATFGIDVINTDSRLVQDHTAPFLFTYNFKS